MPSLDPQSLQPVVTISVSMKDVKGRPLGVLKELAGLTYISDLISESKLGGTGELFIVNPRGEIVLHPKLVNLMRERRSRVPYFETRRPEPTFTGVYQDYTGNDVLGSWKWIPSLRCYLIAEQDTREAFYEIDLLVKKAILIFIISTVLILGISYAVIGRATGPIKRLSETVALFAEGHFAKTVSTQRKDEIGTLITGFNAMAERLKKAYTDLEGKVKASDKELEVAYQMLKQKQEQLVQSEKMAALGQLSAGIAHEIRNPLTSIKIFIQSLEKELTLDRNQEEDFRIVRREIDRINENITRFLNFARPEEPQFQAIHLSTLVKDTTNLLGAKLKSSDISLDLSFPGTPPPVEGDPKQLAQVLLNLLLNSIEAMPQGGMLTIRSSVAVQPESRQPFLQLIIRDTGHGIPEKDRPYLFDPFFTTQPGGTGLGLSIAYTLVQKHTGRIDVESGTGEGAAFILSLPIHQEETWRDFSS
jgi:two-component system NtrC family sensor kinase